MRVALTGAGGRLGRACERALASEGHSVQRWTRRPVRAGDVPFALGAPVDADLLRGVDVVLHAAHDFAQRTADGDRRVNVDGACRLLDACDRAGVGRVLFVSSVAAFEGCRTVYGRGKLAVERAVAASGGRSVRPGLLWGDGPDGAYGLVHRLAALPVLPVPDGGRQPIALAHVDDVALALARASERFDALPSPPAVLAQPGRPAFAAFVRAVAAARGRAVRTVPFPSALALGPLAFLGRADMLRTILWPDPVEPPPPPAALGVAFRAYPGTAVSG